MQQPSKNNKGNKKPQNKQLESKHPVETKSVEDTRMKNQVDSQVVNDQDIHAPPTAEIGRQNLANTQVKDLPSSQDKTMKKTQRKIH